MTNFPPKAGHEISNPEIYHQKIEQFRTDGPEKLQLVFDFDRTLTVPNSDTIQDVTSWSVLGHHLPTEGKRRQQELYETYRHKELDGTMTTVDAENWWRAVLSLFAEYSLDMRAVEDDFVNHVTIRPGVDEIFTWASKHNVPTIILSAGISNVIDFWCKHHTIEPSLVISTSLVLDESGKVTGWADDELVHTLNKRETGHSRSSGILHSRPNTILAGDSIADKAMVPGQEDVLRYFVEDAREDENQVRNALAASEFDVILTDGSMNALRSALGEIA